MQHLTGSCLYTDFLKINELKGKILIPCVPHVGNRDDRASSSFRIQGDK